MTDQQNGGGRGPPGGVAYYVYVQIHRRDFLKHNLQVQTGGVWTNSSNFLLQYVTKLVELTFYGLTGVYFCI